MVKTIHPSEVSGSVRAPSSKSYAQRAIAAALLARGGSRLLDMELCSDTAAALRVAELLGAKHTVDGQGAYLVTGGLRPTTSAINIGESGLSARMFAPIAALCGTAVTIEGGGTIASRPMQMIADPLRELGVEVEVRDGHLPLTVRGPLRGGHATVDGAVSSQFITGLLMALPLAGEDTTLDVTQVSSIPYIDMTLDVLERFGIRAAHKDYRQFYVEGGQSYTPCEYRVEGDWSGASCLLVAGAVAGGITVRNLDPLSKQADAMLVDALSRAGAEITTAAGAVTVRRPERLCAFGFDATQCPDLFPALVALAANCEGETCITGTERLAHKESDRAQVLRQEFGKMGIEVDISGPDVMRITGGRLRGGVTLDSHGDHRIAMSVAAAALRADAPVVIEGAESVAKSYPAFWQDLGIVVND